MSHPDETEDTTAKPPSVRPLRVALRVLGVTDSLAFIAVVMPATWIEWGHQWSGLGEFPDAPIAEYLARSASALYALHGLMILYISCDVRRYWPLIRFMASIAVVHGAIMFGIDVAAGMPGWWTSFEGPAFTATGLMVLVAQYWSKPETIQETAGV
jgi:hypothetical protein